jgi:hypothetical protein
MFIKIAALTWSIFAIALFVLLCVLLLIACAVGVIVWRKRRNNARTGVSSTFYDDNQPRIVVNNNQSIAAAYYQPVDKLDNQFGASDFRKNSQRYLYIQLFKFIICLELDHRTTPSLQLVRNTLVITTQIQDTNVQLSRITQNAILHQLFQLMLSAKRHCHHIM